MQKSTNSKISERLQSLDNHFISQSQEKFIVDGEHKYEVLIDKNPEQKIKMDYFKKKGWGYTDTDFVWDEAKGSFKLLGSRYVYSGKYLPNIKSFFEDHMQFSL